MNTNTGADAEHNYQGVDYGLPIQPAGSTSHSDLENSILVPLRYYGEGKVLDGLNDYPNSNWICYTRLVTR